MESLLLMVAMIAVFYFLIIRPENKRKKQAEQMRSSLKKGDRVTTIGGMVGKIVQVNDSTIVFETSEDRVRIEVTKWAVQSTGAMEQAAAQKSGKKADKVAKATNGNFAALDADGNLKDSGKKAADFVAAEAGKRLMTDAEGTKLGGVAEGATKVEASETNGNVKINGVDTKVYTEPSDVVHGSVATDSEVTEMLNEVFTTTGV